MKPGSLFHFSPNTPTGYETPFNEGALILIFKPRRLSEQDEDFVAYLRQMARRLNREHEAGVPYLLKDLPSDHPAIAFAREVHPDYGH
jgi:hypothetical protein